MHNVGIKPFSCKVISFLFILLGPAVAANQTTSIVPDSAERPHANVIYATSNVIGVPGKSFTAGAVWFVATTNIFGIKDTTGIIRVDWVRVYEIRAVGDTVLFDSTEYNNLTPHHLTINEGGLYSRPFVVNEPPTIFPANDADISNGFLVVNAGKYPNKNSHWWLPRKIISLSSKYIVKALVKVEGNVSLQIGYEYWLNDTCRDEASNHTEGWYSDWINSSTSWVSTQSPNYTTGKFNGGKDYGITINGDFFISKRFAIYGGWRQQGDLINILDIPYWPTKFPMVINVIGADSFFVYKLNNGAFSYNTKVEYCFEFSNDQWLPYNAYINGLIKDSVDVIPNSNNNGFNFKTYPVAPLSTNAIHFISVPAESKLSTVFNNSNNLLTIHGLHGNSIAQIQITNCAGKKLIEKSINLHSSREFSSATVNVTILSNGKYFCKIISENGDNSVLAFQIHR